MGYHGFHEGVSTDRQGDIMGIHTVRQRFIGLLACALAIMLAAAPLTFCGMAKAAELDESKLLEVKGDTAGTVVSFDVSLTNALVTGDLYWIFGNSTFQNSKVGNDLLAAGSNLKVKDAQVAGDMRCLAGGFDSEDLQVDGIVTVGGYDVCFGPETAATGIYCYAGDTIEFAGTAQYAFFYGQTVMINGTVDGDVEVSGQSIEVGPDAVITGTLKVHSGQNVDIPATASVAAVDNTQNQPNTIDQVAQIRSMVAPFFQIGGAVFTLVSFAIMAAVANWAFGPKIREANRMVRSKPVFHLGVGLACVVGVPALVALSVLLVFTIPLAIALLLLFVLMTLVAVPFTGASLGLLMPGKLGDYQKAILGSVVLSVLSQVPYLNILLWVLCLAYLLGYLGYTLFRGHDKEHNDTRVRVEETPAA